MAVDHHHSSLAQNRNILQYFLKTNFLNTFSKNFVETVMMTEIACRCSTVAGGGGDLSGLLHHHSCLLLPLPGAGPASSLVRVVVVTSDVLFLLVLVVLDGQGAPEEAADHLLGLAVLPHEGRVQPDSVPDQEEQDRAGGDPQHLAGDHRRLVQEPAVQAEETVPAAHRQGRAVQPGVALNFVHIISYDCFWRICDGSLSLPLFLCQVQLCAIFPLEEGEGEEPELGKNLPVSIKVGRKKKGVA